MNRFPPPPPWASELFAVGVTGTNGKSTTTRWVAAALAPIAKGPVARLTTVGAYLGEERVEADESYEGFLSVMAEARARGGTHAALEVTSEVLAMGFAKAWPIPMGIFTNLSHDHLDAHKTPEHYLASKAQLFVHLPKTGAAVLNAFDASSELVAEIVPKGVRVLWYGVPSRGASTRAVDVLATSTAIDRRGTTITLAPNASLALPQTLRIGAIGEVFAENALAALAGAIAAGVPAPLAAEAIARAAPPPGRFEIVADEPWVVVDYAHTPDALARTLATAGLLARRDGGRVTVVFGAGGNRDRDKRRAMGEAARVADRVVLTSDNPRDEDPAKIAAAIAAGLEGHSDVVIELDRRAAVARAVRGASRHDVIVVAGKGHETTQTVEGRTIAMSDRELVAEAVQSR